MGDEQQNMLDYLLSREFWLPPNTTWPPQIEKLPKFEHLLTYPVFIAFLLYFLRYIFENQIAVRIGRYFNVKAVSAHALVQRNVKNHSLELYYSKCASPSEAIKMDIAKELSQTYEQVDEWFKARQGIQKSGLQKTTPMNKFTESMWRFVFYFGIFMYGLIVMLKKEWFWKTEQMWIGYPNHEQDIGIFWYYMIELGFYYSLIVSQFFDVKRKDFWQMFTHHIVTVLLMSYSYLANYTRMGSLIVVLHDGVDFWLELAKIAKYAKLQRICDSAFIIFALVWFVTRLVIFPFK